MCTLKYLQNASFTSLRNGGTAKALVGDADRVLQIGEFDQEKLDALLIAFSEFIDLFKDSRKHSSKNLLRQAHKVFEEKVIPSLEASNIKIIDAGDYSNSALTVSSSGDSSDWAQISLCIPLRRHWRKLFSNACYDAHARLEEVAHLLQFLNEGPLSRMGALVENALKENDRALISRLVKIWTKREQRRLFVRENDITGVYGELGIEPPGIFFYPYDRRGVQNFMQSDATFLSIK